MPDMMTINGVTFDRGRTRSGYGGAVAFFYGEDGIVVAAVDRPNRWTAATRRDCAAVLAHLGGSVYLDARGRDVEHPDGEDWAKLLDLAVAAGLQMPETTGKPTVFTADPDGQSGDEAGTWRDRPPML